MSKDAYYINAYNEYCHFCGKQNCIELNECTLCQGKFCTDCIAETTPDATFEKTNLGRGLYCYKCIDNMIRQRQSLPNFDVFWDFIGSMFKGIFKLFFKLCKRIPKFNLINVWNYKERIPNIRINSKTLNDIKFAFRTTLSELTLGQISKLAVKTSLLTIIFALFNVYATLPSLKFINEKTSFLLACIMALFYIAVIDTLLLKYDNQGLVRRLSANKRLPRYLLLLIILLFSPLFGGILALITKILNYILNLLGLEFVLTYFKGITNNLSSYYSGIKNILTKVIASPFQLPK